MELNANSVLNENASGITSDVEYILIPRSKVRTRLPELLLCSFGAIITISGYILTSLVDKDYIPEQAPTLLMFMVILVLIAHAATWILAPRADATILPLSILLNGVGFIIISRLNEDQAQAQALWTALGIVAFIGTLLVVKKVSLLHRYRYTFAFLGLFSILLPELPFFGKEIYGARLWIKVGSFTFQPGEVAKVFLTIFIASYLADTKELLSNSRKKFGFINIPDIKYFGPLLVAWGTSILVMVRQKDLGSSLLFFAVFSAMLYIATNRASFLAFGILMFSGAAVIAYQLFGHVQTRFDTWLNPWPKSDKGGFQLIQSLFSFGTGGIKGTGLGLGTPQKIPLASSDFVFAAIGEELGFLGSCAIIITLFLLVASGFRIAIRANKGFSQIFAAGLTTILGIQSFIIIGGVTRVIPLTGLTLPFVSYGGSSLVANYVIVALLLRISNETAVDNIKNGTMIIPQMISKKFARSKGE